jgi:outer membrane protein TolC
MGNNPSGGCTKVGPDFVKPDAPIAKEWTEVGELQLNPTETDHASWWTAFNDPVLDQLIDEAYNQNLTLQIAGLRILEARAQLGLAVGSAWPQQQQLGLDVNYSSPSDNTAGSAAATSTWNYSTGASIGWEIDFWGKFRRGIESADANLLASIADYDTVLVSLTADVANTYIAIRTFQGSIGLSATQSSMTTASGESGISEWFTGDSLTYVGGPSVTWNIFNYGQISNNVRTQDARLQQLLVNYQNVVLQAAQEVEDSSVGFVRSQEQAGYLKQSVAAAVRSVALAVIQYRDGAVDYTRVLNTQQSLIGQQDQSTVTRGDIAQNLINIYRALGGGWQLRAGKDFVHNSTKEIMSERTNWGDLLVPDEEETAMPPRTMPDDSYQWPDW